MGVADKLAASGTADNTPASKTASAKPLNAIDPDPLTQRNFRLPDPGSTACAARGPQGSCLGPAIC